MNIHMRKPHGRSHYHRGDSGVIEAEIGRIIVWADTGEIDIQPYRDITEDDRDTLRGISWGIWFDLPTADNHVDWRHGISPVAGEYFERIVYVIAAPGDDVVRVMLRDRSSLARQTAAFHARFDGGDIVPLQTA